MIKALIMDFGGVVADEGFREGLKAIGKKRGLDPDIFFETASELAYKTGYVLGKAGERDYWDAVRDTTGITGTDEELREEILTRFRLRPEVMAYVDGLKRKGLVTAILSDQTGWLDEINAKTPFFHHFDRVFNSFRLGKGKRDPSVFADVVSVMGLEPEEALLVDDNPENVKRASGEGLKAVLFTDMETLKKDLKGLLSR